MSNNSATALDGQRSFKFDETVFEDVVAHDGNGTVRTKRVFQSPDQGINFVDLTVVPPGSDIGVHSHTTDNQEIYIVISGHGEMMLDGSEFLVAAGDVVINRPGGTHALHNSSDTDLRLVVIECPVPPVR